MAPNGPNAHAADEGRRGAGPAADFVDLYRQRWRIEEAFKRLKHRMHLESVSGLSQHDLIIDVSAKILASWPTTSPR